MGRPKKKGVYLDIRGRLGIKQLTMGDFMKITKIVSPEYMESLLQDKRFLKPKEQFVLTYLKDELTREIPESPKTYSQDWSSYNKAKTSEKAIFLEILMELCQHVPLEENKGKGRPSLDIQEMIFSMGIFVYANKSSRDTISELKLLKRLNCISKVPAYTSLINYFNNAKLKPILQELITMSSLPLKTVEKDFTVDASGYSTSCFDRWFDHKWGNDKDKESKKRVWRKAHVMSGVKTNIITSIEVTRSNVADTTKFPDLVNKTTKNFNINEVSADKAYSSRKNMNLAMKIGAVPFIPFKKRSTGKNRGSRMWSYMFHFFTDYQDHFMHHYHKRSNSETVFSTLKRKLGMNLRTKNPTGQDNEILMKALVYNILVLIQEMFELGISAEFMEAAKSNFCTNANLVQKMNN